MPGSGDRGSLLLAVRVRSAQFVIAIWVLLALMVVVSFAQWRARGQFFGGALPAGIAVLTFALHPRIRLFDGGVEIPPTHDQHMHYLKWEQVERYSWDGDRLILTGTSSVLGGGPAEGGSVRIPSARRAAVEQVLSMKVRKA